MAKRPPKIRIEKRLDQLDLDYTNLNDLPGLVEDLKAQYSDWENLYLQVDTYQEPYDDWTYAAVYLCGSRMETDEEYTARLTEKREREEKEKKRRLKQYEDLKKEFEK